jgi:hypothetical protein
MNDNMSIHEIEENKYEKYNDLVELINEHIQSYSKFVYNNYFEEIYSKFKTEEQLQIMRDFSRTIFKINNEYDLENLMIYEPLKVYYFDYEYKLKDDTVVKFKSRYIAKIIDYGRAFFNDSTNTGITGSSRKINQTFMEIEDKCDDLKRLNDNFYFIPAQKDVHSDLRILEGLSFIYNVRTYLPTLVDMCQRIRVSKYRSHTTQMAFLELTQILKERQIKRQEHNDKLYSTMESLGTLKIYQIDKKMKFIPNTKI